MITKECIESTWKEIHEYEQTHFGLKFGDDFPLISSILVQSKDFLSLGAITNLLAALDMSSMAQRMKQSTTDSERVNVTNDLMDKPGHIHNTLAEMFYLGYRLGKQTKENEILENLNK